MVKLSGKSNRQAFSLIEMAIVITIVSLIVGFIITKSSLIGVANLTSLRSISLSSPIYNIPDNTLWLDVSAKSAFTPYPSDKTNIDSWTDSSPNLENNIEFVQATQANQPEFIFDSIDGLPALYFDGNDSVHSSSDIFGFNIAATNQITIFLVQKYYSPLHNSQSLTWDSGASNNIEIKAPGPSGSIDFAFGDVSADGSSSATAPANFRDNWRITTFRKSASGVGLIRANASDLVMVDSTMTSDFDASVSDNIKIGETLNGAIREILIYKRALSNDEILDIETYLSRKWQIDID